ncbi:MAG: UDPGP type 1 family protein [Planctomycetota bacterium]|nr:UDPGP type 1 family protein [Planctomycetota bacterium]
MPLTFAAAKDRLSAIGQQHLLTFFDRLSGAEQASLLAQIEALDIAALPGLISTYVTSKPTAARPANIEPAPYYPHDHSSTKHAWDREHYRRLGEGLLRAGKVAAFVVAGGQGSRLGFDGPKGCYPAGAVTNKPLFQIFAEQVLAATRRYGRVVPWYIMTSPLNDAATRAFFKEHRFFGLDPASVMFFPQGVMPSFDLKTGKVLLASPGEIATNPDGHGGAVRALHVSGALADMRARGIEHLSYFQVDNPHVRVCDPVFVGLHAHAPDSSGQMSSKMLAKAGPGEKVGVFCRVNGKMDVIEYSDMPAELSGATNADGSLKFNAGSPAIHLISVAFLEKLASDPAFSLPYHRAEKKIPHVDLGSGTTVNPDHNNGVKLERFIFDALPLCSTSLLFETDRVEEFAPIKNATGADSAESCKALQTLRAARWLKARGVNVPAKPDGSPDCVLEISPLTATSADELNAANLPRAIAAGSTLAL